MEISVTLTIRDWAILEAAMGNAYRDASVPGPGYEKPHVYRRLRELLWDQVPWVGAALNRPPDDESVVIMLQREEWDVAAEVLRMEADHSKRIGDKVGARLAVDTERKIEDQATLQ